MVEEYSERFLSQHSYLFSADLNSALRGVVQVGCRWLEGVSFYSDVASALVAVSLSLLYILNL